MIETRAVWRCTKCPEGPAFEWLYPLDANPGICPRAKVAIDGRVVAGGCMGKLFDARRRQEVDTDRWIAPQEQCGG
jgi:hypothetical protein